MFCPNCGKSDQKPNSYCRQCGEFSWHSSNGLSPLVGFFGAGGNPESQLNFNLLINFATAAVSGALIGFLIGYYDAAFEQTGQGAPTIIYAVYAFLALIAFWQILSAVANLQLKSKFDRRKAADAASVDQSAKNLFRAVNTRELLPEANFENIINASVTEHTTRNLASEKRK